MFPGIPDISDGEFEKIKAWAEDAAQEGKEACGFVVLKKAILEQNTHPRPSDNFRLRNYCFYKDEINLIWHSHHKDSHFTGLSPSDINASNQVGLPILVYHAGFDSWDYYEPLNPNPWPFFPITHLPQSIDFYCGWRFEWARSDCFSLVRRYFLGRLGINIGDFPRPDITPLQIHSNGDRWSYKDFWNKNNEFIIMPPGTQPQEHDIFGIALRGGKEPNHLAVLAMEESNLILHTLGIRHKSRLDVFDSYWRDLVVPGCHGRHKSLC